MAGRLADEIPKFAYLNNQLLLCYSIVTALLQHYYSCANAFKSVVRRVVFKRETLWQSLLLNTIHT